MDQNNSQNDGTQEPSETQEEKALEQLFGDEGTSEIAGDDDGEDDDEPATEFAVEEPNDDNI